MKKLIILLFLFQAFNTIKLHAQCSGMPETKSSQATSMSVVIYSNDIETVWNALRLANYSKTAGDTVCVFLLGKGVEVEKLTDENKDIKEQVNQLLSSGGTILGCGTCLQSRNNNDPKVCKFSSMKDLYDIIRKSKKVLTF